MQIQLAYFKRWFETWTKRAFLTCAAMNDRSILLLCSSQGTQEEMENMVVCLSNSKIQHKCPSSRAPQMQTDVIWKACRADADFMSGWCLLFHKRREWEEKENRCQLETAVQKSHQKMPWFGGRYTRPHPSFFLNLSSFLYPSRSLSIHLIIFLSLQHVAIAKVYWH